MRHCDGGEGRMDLGKQRNMMWKWSMHNMSLWQWRVNILERPTLTLLGQELMRYSLQMLKGTLAGFGPESCSSIQG